MDRHDPKRLLQPTTANGYRSIIDGRLIPHIGDIKVQDLTPPDIARCYKALRSPGSNRRGQDRTAVLSETSIQRTHQVLYTALEWALRQHMIVRNPADDVRKPKRADTEMQVWNSEQLAAFGAVASSARDRLAPFWRLAAYTGMRRSELLGLMWTDVDLETRRLSVRRKRTRVGYQMLAGAGGKTNAAKRTIDLDAGTVEILRAWRTSQNADRLAWQDAGWTETGLVFTRQDGSGIHADHIAAQWARAVRRAQDGVHAVLGLIAGAYGGSAQVTPPALPRIRFHDLRHTHATLLLKAGSPSRWSPSVSGMRRPRSR